MSRYVRWARTERGERTRVTVTALLGPVFLVLLPLAVALGGRRIDRCLGRPPLPVGAAGRVIGGAASTFGFGLGLWSVRTQLGRGRGTPLPLMPTQALLIGGPFVHCRNPMTLGTILAYGGLAVAARTATGLVVVMALAVSLLAYLKLLEEPELAERFGEAYLVYRRRTPFLVPRLTGRR